MRTLVATSDPEPNGWAPVIPIVITTSNAAASNVTLVTSTSAASATHGSWSW